MLYILVSLLVILIDQGIKLWVVGHIALHTGAVSPIPGVLNIVHLHNYGAAFSFLAGGEGRFAFIAIALGFAAAVAAAIRSGFISKKFEKLLLVLLAAGGVSNCIDRIFRGYVVDMFELTLFRFPVFNFADSIITLSCLILIIGTLFQKTP